MRAIYVVHLDCYKDGVITHSEPVKAFSVEADAMRYLDSREVSYEHSGFNVTGKGNAENEKDRVRATIAFEPDNQCENPGTTDRFSIIRTNLEG